MKLSPLVLLLLVVASMSHSISFSQCTTPSHGSVGIASSYYLTSVTTLGALGKSQLQIRDAQGRLIAAYNWSHSSNNWTEPLNLSKQAAGVYTLELETEQGRSVHRISIR